MALALLSLLSLLACGHEATVVVLGPDRPELDRFVDGKILGSDRDRLYLRHLRPGSGSWSPPCTRRT
jgi:hypothetical protein